ncbi:hypothetical protein GGF50DRAFT_131012 [Schizophyllum commune]
MDDSDALVHLLTVLKPHRPDKFCENLRVTPATFDKLLAAIQNDPVFYNNSQNDQIDVSHQLAIALYRFGHFGNAVSLQKVANWSGYSKGTVNLVTRRVMTALLRPSFRERCVRRPTDTEKERAKQWVEAHSCKEWRDGYCMVDGTLVPLYTRPYFFGESYFDHVRISGGGREAGAPARVSLRTEQLSDLKCGFPIADGEQRTRGWGWDSCLLG